VKGVLKSAAVKDRRILHVDLHPFFVSVERANDPSLEGRPVVVGGEASSPGLVAAASTEARQRGVRPGQSLAKARSLCPEAVFRPGDLEAYARASEEVTAILLAASRRVERPSTDEAYVDLSPDSATTVRPVAAAERIKDEIQKRLGLAASLGLASSRLAARVASTWARPRGLLIVLPGYEASFIGRQPVSFLPDLPPHLERALEAAGFATLGQLQEAPPEAVQQALGAAGVRLQEAARGLGEEPIPVAAPPSWVHEEARVRDSKTDLETLREMVSTLAARAVRRLRPFGLAAGAIVVEVRRRLGSQRRSETLCPGLTDEATAEHVASLLAEPILEPPGGVLGIQVRLTRLARPASQVPLFPWQGGLAR